MQGSAQDPFPLFHHQFTSELFIRNDENAESTHIYTTVLRLLLQPLQWRCFDCVIHNERKTYACGMNKQ